jgi:hypothetical protein
VLLITLSGWVWNSGYPACPASTSHRPVTGCCWSIRTRPPTWCCRGCKTICLSWAKPASSDARWHCAPLIKVWRILFFQWIVCASCTPGFSIVATSATHVSQSGVLHLDGQLPRRPPPAWCWIMGVWFAAALSSMSLSGTHPHGLYIGDSPYPLSHIILATLSDFLPQYDSANAVRMCIQFGVVVHPFALQVPPAFRSFLDP